jgi:hypothetical protein
MKLGGHGRQMGRLNRAFQEKRARFYIFRRCAVMLLRPERLDFDIHERSYFGRI